MAVQTLVLSHVPDSVPCIAIRKTKVALKQAASNKRILRTQEKKTLVLLTG